MRYAVLLAVLAAGCGKKAEPTTGGAAAPTAPTEKAVAKGDATGKGAEPKPVPVRDMAEYVKELRETVPVRVDEFKAKKLKCSTYYTSKLAGIEVFDSMTLVIEPVNLADELTGKTRRYIGARLVRSDMGDVFATGSSADAALGRKNGFIPFTWREVEMVPGD